MANLFKHFFRIGKVKQKGCMLDLPSSTEKPDCDEQLYDLHLPALVKFDYTAERDDELSLVKGTRIIVIEKCSDGWWRGTNNGLFGWFPSNYVTEDVDGTMRGDSMRLTSVGHNNNGSQVLETVQALYHFSSGNVEELNFNKDELMDVLEKPENDPEWWKCRKENGQVGLVPKNYVTVVQKTHRELGNSGPLSSNYDIKPFMGGKFGGKPWYYGKLTRHQAETVLNQRGVDGDFLIRDSESMPNDFSISLKAVYKNKHFKVQLIDGLYCIGQRKFSSMEDLVEHYKKAPIYTSEYGDKLYLIKALT